MLVTWFINYTRKTKNIEIEKSTKSTKLQNRLTSGVNYSELSTGSCVSHQISNICREIKYLRLEMRENNERVTKISMRKYK